LLFKANICPFTRLHKVFLEKCSVQTIACSELDSAVQQRITLGTHLIQRSIAALKMLAIRHLVQQKGPTGHNKRFLMSNNLDLAMDRENLIKSQKNPARTTVKQH